MNLFLGLLVAIGFLSTVLVVLLTNKIGKLRTKVLLGNFHQTPYGITFQWWEENTPNELQEGMELEEGEILSPCGGDKGRTLFEIKWGTPYDRNDHPCDYPSDSCSDCEETCAACEEE